MSNACEIASLVKLSEVCHALGAPEPRNGRITAFWRSGDGFNVAVNDEKGAWFDFAAGEGGGILDLVQRATGCSRSDALRWVAEFAGVPLDDRKLTPAERREWAAQRETFERDLRVARLWRRSAVALYEETLTEQKAALFNPEVDFVEHIQIRRVTERLDALRRASDAELVAEYRWWAENYPAITAAMILTAQEREQAEQRALWNFLESFTGGADESH